MPLQIIQALLSIGFAVAAWILCAESRRNLIRAQAAATRARSDAVRAEDALARIKALRIERPDGMTEQLGCGVNND